MDDPSADTSRPLIYQMAHLSTSPASIAPADTTTPTKLQLTHPPPKPKVLAGHASTVNPLAFFPSGCQLISGSSDQTLRIWDVEAKEQIGPPLEGRDGIVQAVAVSRDGRVASGGFDRTVRVWDACSVSGNDGEVGKDVKENVMGEKQQEWTLTEVFGTTDWVLSVDLSMDDGKRSHIAAFFSANMTNSVVAKKLVTEFIRTLPVIFQVLSDPGWSGRGYIIQSNTFSSRYPVPDTLSSQANVSIDPFFDFARDLMLGGLFVDVTYIKPYNSLL
ncbi:WD40-repeat-containing domain protein [Phlebopus sp. FC_14]|nr:WD40-repeat-containing domain protein [Phlebopus sp. FC_14]